MKKICFITTSRADFGMIKVLVGEALKQSKNHRIFLIISGNHNDKFYGKSIREIKFNQKIKIFKVFLNQRNKDSLEVSISFSNFLKIFSYNLKKINPDVFVAFGDRYEMLAATISAYIQRIPIVHIAGGEKTSGSLDEGFRHSITKLSNLHFPTSNIYKKRIIQLGEDPKTVFNYGSLNRQKIVETNFLSKIELEKKFKISFLKKNILMTLHPHSDSARKNLKNLKLVLDCLNTLKHTRIFLTSPNADAGGIEMIKLIESYIKNKKKFILVKSFGTLGYLSLLKYIDGVIGNSSSGISEVPMFSIKTINLGNRQKGRQMDPTIISCKFDKKKILKNLNMLGRKNNFVKKRLEDKIVARKIFKKIVSFNYKKYNYKDFKDIKFKL